MHGRAMQRAGEDGNDQGIEQLQGLLNLAALDGQHADAPVAEREGQALLRVRPVCVRGPRMRAVVRRPSRCTHMGGVGVRAASDQQRL